MTPTLLELDAIIRDRAQHVARCMEANRYPFDEESADHIIAQAERLLEWCCLLKDERHYLKEETE